MSGESDDETNHKQKKNDQLNPKEKQYKNKGLVNEEKMKNKKQYKEAKRKIKMKQKQGTLNKIE